MYSEDIELEIRKKNYRDSKAVLDWTIAINHLCNSPVDKKLLVLLDRLEKRERSIELYNEIMEIA